MIRVPLKGSLDNFRSVLQCPLPQNTAFFKLVWWWWRWQVSIIFVKLWNVLLPYHLYYLYVFLPHYLYHHSTCRVKMHTLIYIVHVFQETLIVSTDEKQNDRADISSSASYSPDPPASPNGKRDTPTIKGTSLYSKNLSTWCFRFAVSLAINASLTILVQ